MPLRERCKRIAKVAAQFADNADEWTRLCRRSWRENSLETISGELLPLCSALRWIGRRGPSLLRPKRLGVFGRPLWLWGVRNEVHRQPHGEVLILGTWNYPLLLVGTQIAQALAAGNRVLFKPAEGCEALSERLVQAFYECGIPGDALQLLDSSKETAVATIDAGVDLIVLTGSAATGKAIFRQAAETLTPMILELSGCDAVLVLPGSDLKRAADAIAFGLSFNSGATCIGPRRLIGRDHEVEGVLQHLLPTLALSPELAIHPAAQGEVGRVISQCLESGGEDRTGRYSQKDFEESGRMAPLVIDRINAGDAIANTDLFAPVLSAIRVKEIKDAIEIINDCRYRLAASVFGPPSDARSVGSELSVGSTTINDLIVPTADPRVSFGGRGDSGFGVTRGESGLLAMTVPVLKGRRVIRFTPHLVFRSASDAQTLLGALRLMHGSSIRSRFAGLRRLVSSVMRGRNDNE